MCIRDLVIFSIVFLLEVEPGYCQEISVRDHVYINEVDKFILPVPVGYHACYALPGQSMHDVVISPSSLNCTNADASNSTIISVLRIMGNETEPQEAGKYACGKNEIAETSHRVGASSVFTCASEKSDNLVRVFFIRTSAGVNRNENFIYLMTAVLVDNKSADPSRRKPCKEFRSQSRGCPTRRLLGAPPVPAL